MTSNEVPLLLGDLSPLPEDVWRPRKHLLPPDPPPPPPEIPITQEMAAAQGIDGKMLLKKTKPRRTVDYFSPMGLWLHMRKTNPNPRVMPFIRPAAPYIIDLLPPHAYPDNASTSLCTKFVHTSTNKVRCPVNVVTWTPEGRRVLTGSTSGEFTLWNGLTFNFETILQAHDNAIRAFQFSHAGDYLVSGDHSGIIKYFQPNMNNMLSWQAHNEPVRGLSFSPNDSRFVTASDDSTLKLWGFEEAREERTFTGHGWDVRCVEWHPTKGLIVSGSKDNLVKFWDPRTGTCISTLHQHKNTIQAISWSPNGDFVAAASRDQSVSVFDIRAMKEFRMFKGHKKEVCSVTWHPFHPLLVSGGSEGDLIYWDLYAPPANSASAPITTAPGGGPATQALHSDPRAVLAQAHDSNIWSLQFHPMGHLLASASNDHTTRFWSRERPGDITSVFSGGGEKPPEVDPDADDDFDGALPGLGDGGGGGGFDNMANETDLSQFDVSGGDNYMGQGGGGGDMGGGMYGGGRGQGGFHGGGNNGYGQRRTRWGQ